MNELQCVTYVASVPRDDPTIISADDAVIPLTWVFNSLRARLSYRGAPEQPLYSCSASAAPDDAAEPSSDALGKGSMIVQQKRI